jgi:hypothetical protein
MNLATPNASQPCLFSYQFQLPSYRSSDRVTRTEVPQPTLPSGGMIGFELPIVGLFLQIEKQFDRRYGITKRVRSVFAQLKCKSTYEIHHQPHQTLFSIFYPTHCRGIVSFGQLRAQGAQIYFTLLAAIKHKFVRENGFNIQSLSKIEGRHADDVLVQAFPATTLEYVSGSSRGKRMVRTSL